MAGLFPLSKQPLLDWKNPLLAKLARDLQELDGLPLGTPTEVVAWKAASDALRNKFYSEYSEIYASLPHEIEHYLTDYDIRFRDPGYAEYQRGLLYEFLNFEKKAK